MANHERAVYVAVSLSAGPYEAPSLAALVVLADAYLEALALIAKFREFSFAIEQLPMPPKPTPPKL